MPIGVYYFPGWDTPGAWAAIPAERRPVGGAYDETLQSVCDRQLTQMRDNGIDYVALCWYWDAAKGRVHAGHWARSYLASSVERKPRLCLLYCNADIVPATSSAQWQAIHAHWVEHYFASPHYHRVDGRPLVVLLDHAAFKKHLGDADDAAVAARLAAARSAAADVGGITFYAASGDFDDSVRAMGFDGYTAYNFVTGSAWDELIGHYNRWFAKAAAAPLPVILPVTTGWDNRPWGGGLIANASIAQFRAHLLFARAVVAAARPGQITGITAFAWNEMGEGGVLEPTPAFGGTARLETLQTVFGARR